MRTTTDDKNLVMIICTSIFVPLGVVGIAAGVYFFFFHEFVKLQINLKTI